MQLTFPKALLFGFRLKAQLLPGHAFDEAPEDELEEELEIIPDDEELEEAVQALFVQT